MFNLSLDPLSLAGLEQAFLLVQERLRSFARDPEFSQKLALAFGGSFDGEAAQGLALAWQNEDFSAIPTLEVLSAVQLNGANGAFAGAIDRIYLSEEFISRNATNIEVIARVLLEEIGHGVDQLLNEADSAGDEGAIFADLVLGESLSDEALAQLKAENDSGVINVNGQTIAVERQDFFGTTERISVASDGTQANDISFSLAISADGKYVAFQSYATNLVSGDTNSNGDIFVHDRITGITELVSIANDGTQGNSWAFGPSISGDGRYVAFDSYASNFVTGDTNFERDIFVRDRFTGITVRVNLASDGTEANAISDDAQINADGKYIAFYSEASNLVLGDTNSVGDIFVHDRTTDVTERVSVASDGTQFNNGSLEASISADGRYVAFTSLTNNFEGENGSGIYVHDRVTGITESISLDRYNSYNPSISADGRYVAFTSDTLKPYGEGDFPFGEIFIYDRVTDTTEQISTTNDDFEFFNSDNPLISDDGRYVTFELAGFDEFGGRQRRDIVVYDRSNKISKRVSAASDGTPANSFSYEPKISADGKQLAFFSYGSNLVAGDTNSFGDIFVHNQAINEGLPDLVVEDITVPNTILDEEIAISYMVRNQGTKTTIGTWRDAIYISPDNRLDATDKLLGTATRITAVNPSETYTQSITGLQPGLLPGNYYVIVRSDAFFELAESSDFNNTSTAEDLIALDLPSLELGVAVNGSLGAKQARYYKLDVEAGKTLLLDFDSESDSAANELYISYGEIPTRGKFDFAFSNQLSPDHNILIPSSKAGTYYILAYGNNVPDNEPEFTIEAQNIDELTVFDQNYGRGGTAGQLTIEIKGAQFDRTVTAFLSDGAGFQLAASSYYYVDKTKLYATFDLIQTTPGFYDVVVENAQGARSVVNDGLEVVAGGGGTNTPQIDAPTRVGVNRQIQFTVSWTNEGINDVRVPLLNVGNNNSFGFEAKPIGFSPGPESSFTQTQLVFLGTSSEDGPPGILRPGQSESLTLFGFSGLDMGDYIIYVDRLVEDPNRSFDWAAIRSQLISEGMSDAEFQPIFEQLIAQVGITWRDYLQMLTHNATLLPEILGDNRNVSDLLNLKIQKATAALGTSIQGVATTPDLGIILGGRLVNALNIDTGESFTTTTLNDGSFVFASVTPGSYELSVEGVLLISDNTLIVAPEQSVFGINLALAKGVQIAGRVIDFDASSGVAGANISAQSESGISFSVSTDRNGTYLIEGLPSGAYSLLIEANGKARQILNVEVTDLGLIQNLVLNPASVINGTVNFQAVGSDIGELRVIARPSGDTPSVNLFTANIANSNFSLSNLPAGIYDLTVSRNGYVTQTITDVSVSAAQTLNLGIVNLVPTGQITGSVIDSNNSNPDSVNVSLFNGDIQIAEASTDVDDNFSIQNIAPGTYTLRVTNLTNQFSSEIQITVNPGEILTAEPLQIFPGGSITGTVREEGTLAPQGGIPVIAIDEDGNLLVAQTDASGTYRFDGLDLGSYTITIPTIAFTSTISITDLSQATETVDFELKPTVAALEGRLLTASGESVANGSVSLFESGQFILSTTTDADGRYKFKLFRGGTFDLLASADGVSFNSIADVVVNSSDTIQQDFTSGNAVLSLTLSDSVQSVEGASVFLYQRTTGERLFVGQAEVDSTGVVQFTNLVSGNYEINVVSSNNRGNQTLTTLTNGTNNLAITLEKQSLLSGSIKDSSNNPLGSGLVTLVSQADSEIQFSSFSFNDGSYTIPNVANGIYDLIISADGYKPIIQKGLNITSSQTLDIGLEASTTSLTGRLIDSKGNPVTFGFLSVDNQDGYSLGQTSIQPDGTFRFLGIEGNNLSLTSTIPGFVAQPVDFFNITPLTNFDLENLTAQTVAQPQSPLIEIPLNALSTPIDELSTATFSTASLAQTNKRNWSEILFDDYQPRIDALLKNDIAPLPANAKPHCINLYRKVLQVIDQYESDDVTDFYGAFGKYGYVKVPEDALDDLIPKFLTLVVAEVVAVVGAAAALILVIEPLITLAAGTPSILGSAARGFTIAGSLGSIADTLRKYGAFGQELKDSRSTEQSKNVLNEISKLISLQNNSLRILLELTGKVPDEFKTFARITGLYGAVTKFTSQIDKLVKDTFKELDTIQYFENQFALGISKYENLIDQAKYFYAEYLKCLREEDEEDEPLPPGPDGIPDAQDTIARPTSYDPNDILGPEGFGSQGWIKPPT